MPRTTLDKDSRMNSDCGCWSQPLSAVQSSLLFICRLVGVCLAAVTRKAAETIIAAIISLKIDCFFITFEMFDEVSAIMLREF